MILRGQRSKMVVFSVRSLPVLDDLLYDSTEMLNVRNETMCRA